ncbi:hypothetical protein CAP39_08800 [Sphingomonas sp. IBVSS1]|nr:hypothetical protein CAP39_08800 [Sphingomonas sp. IBVSS1]
MMRRRWPQRATLLLSLLPLLLGLAAYAWAWRGWAADFETTLAGWFPGRTLVATGFPYRLEAELAGVERRHDGPVQLVLRAERLRLNRGPWRPELTVFQGQGVALATALGPLTARVAAGSGNASLHLVDGRLRRLSLVLPAATGNAGFGPDFTASALELHLRERQPGAAADAAQPQPRGQLVIGATGLRLGQGAALSLDADLVARGRARLTDYRAWAGDGVIDASATLRDATGEVLKLDASIVPLGTGMRLAGTITTVCPLAVQALLAGTAAPAEARLRAPVRLAVETALPAGGPVALSGLPADLAGRSRRGQLPPCPHLR